MAIGMLCQRSITVDSGEVKTAKRNELNKKVFLEKKLRRFLFMNVSDVQYFLVNCHAIDGNHG